MAKRFTFSAAIATLAMLATTLGTAASAQTTTPCGTAPAGYNVVVSNARFVIGTPGPDFICAGDANNIIRAQGKDDIIYAGGGNDVIWAGYGDDTVYAGEGNDLIRAGGGLDRVWGEAGDDRVLAGNGPDIIRGGDGDDRITGGEGHDLLYGDDGNDMLVANKGIDRVFGGPGNDTAQGGIGVDKIVGGPGNDVLFGGDHDDTLSGGDGVDRLIAGNGADDLSGGAGNDVLLGGGNPDTMRGGGGDDLIDGGNGLNFAIGGDGVDSCLNTDDPTSDCEIIDGIDSRDIPALITLTVPPAGPAMIVGTDWTPDTEIDLFSPDLTLLQSDANGDWSLSRPAAGISDVTIRVEDSAAGRIKTLTPTLMSSSYLEASRTLTVTGPTDKTVEAFVYDANGTLIFVEQLTFDEAGTAVTDFREIMVPFARIDLQANDADGDRERYPFIWSAAA